MRDQIIISRLKVASSIGATAPERSQPQTLEVSLLMELEGGFDGLNDTLERTVDYAVVAQRVKLLAASGERQLIETLALEIAELLLQEYPLATVDVEVRKFVLPDAESVAVRIRRER